MLDLKIVDNLVSIKRNLWKFIKENPEISENDKLKKLFIQIDENLKNAYLEIHNKERVKNETI
jgi:hypothetical protein